jgi:hypothetical protein
MATFSEQLETMIDNATLDTVLDTLVDICHGKAEHLESNWQDRNAAKAWMRAAKRIDSARAAIHSLAL